MIADRRGIRGSLDRLQQAVQQNKTDEKVNQRLEQLEQRLERSAAEAVRRQTDRPRPQKAPDLPIHRRRSEIVSAIERHRTLIISGETGSGKSTQLPQLCLLAGRGIQGIIGCTQPRRIAATSVARRIADELGRTVGGDVGYKIRFHDETRRLPYIKIMTDGILLAETQHDPLLTAYDTLIIDEAHERSLNIDFILGCVQRIMERRRDLKLIITSATIDTEKFSKAFGGAPVIEVSGRAYPVELRYRPPESFPKLKDEPGYVETAAAAVAELQEETPWGDILVFMPTEQDIRETCDLIAAQSDPSVLILPLFARLSEAEQTRIFSPAAGRKIIVATNIAETSITVPGIRFVVDTGLARISRYLPRSRSTALPVTPISQSSADQRKGRCGRIAEGVCVRLYSEDDFLQRPVFTPPEIRRANLAEVILRMTAWRLGDVKTFPFIDRPVEKSVQDGFELLLELGAIFERSSRRHGRRFDLTDRGRIMARIPLDPRLSRMLIEARPARCLDPITVIASVLSIQDPRERPPEKSASADEAHALFKDPSSDFYTYINIWHRYDQLRQAGAGSSRLKKFCRDHFLSWRRMREWSDIYSQMRRILAECGIHPARTAAAPPAVPNQAGGFNADYTAFHRCILTGFLSSIAQQKAPHQYQTAKGREAMIFPGSVLFNKGSEWIVAAELVETSRLFARTAARIDPRWLEDLGGGLCRYSYAHPRWDRNRGEVIADEQVRLFSLIIVPQRRVSFGRIDPQQAADIFIRQALVAEDVEQPLPFMKHNANIIEAVRHRENKLRRRDILVNEDQRAQFYAERLGSVYNWRTLQKRIRQAGGDRFLRMTEADVYRRTPAASELADYPDQVRLGGRSFSCSYQFAPGEKDDGLTVAIPAKDAGAVPPAATDWLVPGLLSEKITALIKNLPKVHRRRLAPVSRTVELIMAEMPRSGEPLPTSLSRFIYKRFGLDIPASAWSEDALPDHLKMRLALTAPDGAVLYAGREKAALHRGFTAETLMDTDEAETERRRWEKKGLTAWDFGDLPLAIPLRGAQGAQWELFAGLVDRQEHVDLRLFTNAAAAQKFHAAGVARLYRLQYARDMKRLHRRLELPVTVDAAAAYFGGRKACQARLFDSIADDTLARGIRTQRDFEAFADEAMEKMVVCGDAKLRAVVALLERFHSTARFLFSLERAGTDKPPIREFVSALRQDAAELMPKNFIGLYTAEKMADIERYLQALSVRAERGVVHLEKDRSRAAVLEPYQTRLKELTAALSPSASQEKKEAVESYFWLLQEFKVSLFAQELKTRVPVSAKRLDKMLQNIDRMV